MKKIVDNKTGRKTVVFNQYNLNNSEICPECGRKLNSYDFKLLNEIGKRSCTKCGAILLK